VAAENGGGEVRSVIGRVRDTTPVEDPELGDASLKWRKEEKKTTETSGGENFDS